METAAVNSSNKKVTWRNDTNSRVTVVTVPVSGAHTENAYTGNFIADVIGADATATTFVLDSIKDEDDDYTFTVQCDMSKTYAKTCTTINIGSNDNGSPTATFPRTASDTSLYEYHGYGSFTWVPVTVTAGHQYLFTTAPGSAKAAEATTPNEKSTRDTDDGDSVTITGQADPSKTDDNVVTITGEAEPSKTSESSAYILRGLSVLT
ncbi:hypothetical protein FCOIX_13383 [Fusarium coicis]|nr:hypothetical protein FCOIX_13383 [Fusarium coicis]